MSESAGEIYSATYSNVPVYELKISTSEHVMRRRSDDWINATHILKIAGFDKPARTRILEREVQKGVHEKIQGGYGKYQGTWIPLGEGRALAEKNGVLQRIGKIFDYVPGDRSPPPAPKHQTAASGRPKPPRQPAAAPRHVQRQPLYAEADSIYQDQGSEVYQEESRGRATPETQSFLAEEDFGPLSQNSTASRKRKRDEQENAFTQAEIEHTMYGDELLDYFVTAGDDPAASNMFPPVPPDNFNVNRPIDTHGNNALHWACAMGDVQVTKDLIRRGANISAENTMSGETPLMRAVLFTNNYDKQTFPSIVSALAGSIVERDWHGATVFHHIAETARTKSKWSCARYYCEVLVNKMQEMGTNYVQTLLRSVDTNGDTAVLCAVRNGCIKVATFLLNHCPEAGDQANHRGETANEFLRVLREKRDSLEQPPSSPPRPGELYGGRRKARTSTARQNNSRAASNVLSKVESAAQEASTKLALFYDAEMKEKDDSIKEAKQALADFEAQRHKMRQDKYALMAKQEDEGRLQELREQYAATLRETESLLEQKDHSSLQNEMRLRDQQTNPQAFKAANPNALNDDEIQTALPWVATLFDQQQARQQLVRDIARLTAEAGTGEKIGKHRKLVAIATGLKEDDLDSMSIELLESLQATQAEQALVDGDGPSTPLIGRALEVV